MLSQADPAENHVKQHVHVTFATCMQKKKLMFTQQYLAKYDVFNTHYMKKHRILGHTVHVTFCIYICTFARAVTASTQSVRHSPIFYGFIHIGFSSIHLIIVTKILRVHWLRCIGQLVVDCLF